MSLYDSCLHPPPLFLLPPYPNSQVIRRTRKELPTRRKGERPDGRCVCRERLEVVPVVVWVVDVELDGVVVGAGCEDLEVLGLIRLR